MRSLKMPWGDPNIEVYYWRNAVLMLPTGVIASRITDWLAPGHGILLGTLIMSLIMLPVVLAGYWFKPHWFYRETKI